MHATHHAVGVARIGPNAIIQTVGAMEEERGPEATRYFLQRSGRGDLALQLPTTMVAEHDFISLIDAVRSDHE